MIKQRVASRPAVRQDESAVPPASPPPRERRLALSNLAHRAVVTFGERGHQRRTLINILILAQALLFLASAPGYLGGHPDTLPLVALGFGVFVCLVAWILNQLFRDPGKAAYALVFGSSVAVLLQVFLAAASGNPVQASQTSLLLLAVILDAALLFSPEATLIAAGTAIALTIVALLLALARGNDLSRPETYALVEDTLGLLSVTGLIAWLLAQFVYDSAVEAQRARDLQFAQARLDALVTQSADQRRRIEGAAANLQQAITRAASGDFSMRASVAEGELSAVASGLNALLERLQGLGPRDLARHVGAPSWVDVGRGVGEGSTPTPGSMPLMGGAPLDVAAPEASLPRRLLRVQELAGEIVGALAHSQNGLNTMAETAAEALRTVGASLAAADGMLTGSQQGVELAARARRALSAMFPGDAARESRGEPRARDASGLDPSEAAALLGLGPDLGVGGPGMTGSFSMLGTFDVEPAGSTGASAAAEDMPSPPEVSAPLPSRGPKGDAQEQQDATAEDGTPAAAGKRRRGGRGASDAKAPAPELVAELQQAIDQLHDEVVRQERTASTLTHDLGLANRNVRGVDIGVSWTRQALEAVRRNAERLYQTAGGNAPPLAGDPGPTSHPLPPDMPARVPTATRPLAERARIASGPLAADLGVGGGAVARSADAAGPAGERADGPGSPAGEQGS